MDVTLPPEVEQMILERVRAGAYASTSELLNAAVRNLLAPERSLAETAARPDPKSLELAQDAPANLDWLRANGAAYRGEWVALHKGALIAHGENGLEVFRAAQARGIDTPLMHRIVPEELYLSHYDDLSDDAG